MWAITSAFIRWERSRSLRREATWREFYDRCKATLFTLLRGMVGSSQAAEDAFQRIFVLYTKECVAKSEHPSMVGILQKAVRWLRQHPLAVEVDKSDSSAPLRALPLEQRLAFLFWFRLGLEPDVTCQALLESENQVFSQAVAASRRLYTPGASELIRSRP